jgi:hypothetical protein
LEVVEDDIENGLRDIRVNLGETRRKLVDVDYDELIGILDTVIEIPCRESECEKLFRDETEEGLRFTESVESRIFEVSFVNLFR